MDNLLIEVRYAEDDSRQGAGRLAGTLVRYGERARRRKERFMPNSLHWADDGIPLNEQHVRAAIFARAFPYLDGPELKIDTVIPNTVKGRDAVTNVKAKVLTGLSVEILAATVQSRMVNGIREISYADLVGASLVDLAEYRGSTVEVRSAGGILLPSIRTMWK